VQDNYSVSRMTGRVRLTNSENLAKSVPKLEEQLKTDFANENVKLSLTGFIKLMSSMEQYLLKSQLKSFLVAFIIITLMLWALLRSFKLALFSMIPNFAPICIGLGVMSALGIPLDPGTVMIGGLALGLVVDDTVHFLVRFRRKLNTQHSMATAVAETITEVGRPITVTSIILSISFLILLLGSFTPNIHFGGVTSIVVLLALFADLLILPSAMYLIKPKF
jgi:predicted RND superfamily exporter protein